MRYGNKKTEISKENFTNPDENKNTKTSERFEMKERPKRGNRSKISDYIRD